MRILLALVFLPGLCLAQNNAPPASPVSDEPRLILNPINPRANSGPQASIDRLTQANAELLDLLKKQQAVLEDIQFDRRLQSRQIESLEERLQETLVENTQLQNKIDKLSSAANNTGSATSLVTPQASGATTNQSPQNPTSPPAPPASLLPAAPVEVASAAPGWHRLFILSGTDSKSTDLFQIQGHQWRVFWHNQDPDGKAYKNTSALFLNAFPKDDTIPQKVCAQLGSGGDVTELAGPGNYYLKIEASGGSWELAVEDFH